MEKILIDYLKEVEDYRGTRGRRYPLWLLLLRVILGGMSDCRGYSALEERTAQQQAARSIDVQSERTRDRVSERKVAVYDTPMDSLHVGTMRAA